MANISLDQANEIVKANKQKLPWCMAPFIGLFHNFNSSSPCCENTNSTPCYKRGESPEQFMYGDFMKNLRKSFIESDYDSLPQSCKVCLNSPSSHSKFYTLQGREELVETYLEYKDKFDKNGDIEHFPLTHLALGVSNKCNAACRMCFPVTSSAKLKLFEEAGLVDYTHHPETDLEFRGTVTASPLQPCLDIINKYSGTLREIVIHGGDPSQSDELPAIFDALLPYKDTIRINFLTNGTFDRLADGRLIWEILKPFYKVDVVFSIDSIPEVNEYIRIGLKTRRILKLAIECKKYLGNSPNVFVGIHSTLSNYSIPYLPQFLDWIEKNTLPHGIWLSMNVVNRPVYNAPHNLPPELRNQALKNLCDYKTDNEHFQFLIRTAKNALLRYPFSPSDWNTCLWMDKKQDAITGMSFPLFEPYQKNIIDIVDWNQDFLHDKTLNRPNCNL